MRAKLGEDDRSSLLLKCAAIGARLSRGDGSRPGRDQILQSVWREFAIENGDSDLCKAVRAFVGPAHLALLGHALADDQIHGRFGDAAADWQAFSIWRCCMDADMAEASPSPAVSSGNHSWIADGVWPSGVQHAIEYRHTDGRLRALARHAARAGRER